MTKSEMIEMMAEELSKQYSGGNYKEFASHLLILMQDNGMLPPVNECKLIPHKDGGTKHSPSKREWDDE